MHHQSQAAKFENTDGKEQLGQRQNLVERIGPDRKADEVVVGTP